MTTECSTCGDPIDRSQPYVSIVRSVETMVDGEILPTFAEEISVHHQACAA